MKTFDVRRYDMLVRVKEFGAAHADLFPADTLGGQSFARLAASVDRLTAGAGSESSGRTEARQGGAAKAQARAALRTALEAIARTARGLAVATPDVAGRFPPPGRSSDHQLVTTARRVAADAASYAAGLVAHGLPSTFVADLGTAIDAFEHARSTRTAATETHVAARASIRAAMDGALAALPQVDAIVENRVAGDPGLLAAWRSARHVAERMPSTPAPAAAAAATSTPAAATPAAATAQAAPAKAA